MALAVTEDSQGMTTLQVMGLHCRYWFELEQRSLSSIVYARLSLWNSKTYRQAVPRLFDKSTIHLSNNIPPLSSPLPSPPSRAPFAGISTGCSGKGHAPGFGSPFPRTTSACRPPGVRTVLGKLRWAHARTLTGRILLPMTLPLPFGQVSCCLLCPSVCSRSDYCICRPPTGPWLLIFLRRSV
jgi:hypothetical protein